MKNVIITDGIVRIRATLNDTLAARDFEKRLPFTCSGYDSGIDYCCSAANGLYDPLETQIGWKNGDGVHTLEHAEEIGLGSRTYELVSIDD